jgi:hypothetical protein
MRVKAFSVLLEQRVLKNNFEAEVENGKVYKVFIFEFYDGVFFCQFICSSHRFGEPL